MKDDGRIARLMRAAGRDVGLLLGAGVAALALLAFMNIAEEVLEGDLRAHAIDRSVLLALRAADDPSRPLAPTWVTTAATDVTALGSLTVLLLVTLFVAGLFAAQRRWRAAAVMVLAPGSGLALSQALKLFFGRDRPDETWRLVEVFNASFPSGHAMLSAIAYLTLGALAARFVASRRTKAFAIGGAVVLTLLVGLSRIYLGAHWPTDVLAGWCLGTVWALGWWLAARTVDRLRPGRPS